MFTHHSAKNTDLLEWKTEIPILVKNTTFYCGFSVVVWPNQVAQPKDRLF